MSKAPRKPYQAPRVQRFTEDDIIRRIEFEVEEITAQITTRTVRLTRLLGMLRVLRVNEEAR